MLRNEFGSASYTNRPVTRPYEPQNLNSSSRPPPLDTLFGGDDSQGTEFDHAFHVQTNSGFNINSFDATPSTTAPKAKQRHEAEHITPPTEADKKRRGSGQRVNLFGAMLDQDRTTPEAPLAPEPYPDFSSFTSQPLTDAFRSSDVDLSNSNSKRVRHFESPEVCLWDSHESETESDPKRRWPTDSHPTSIPFPDIIPTSTFTSFSDPEVHDGPVETHPIGPKQSQYYKIPKPNMNGSNLLKKKHEDGFSEQQMDLSSRASSPHRLSLTPSSPHRHNPPPVLLPLSHSPHRHHPSHSPSPHRIPSPPLYRSSSNSPAFGTPVTGRSTPPQYPSSPHHQPLQPLQQQLSPHRHPSPYPQIPQQGSPHRQPPPPASSSPHRPQLSPHRHQASPRRVSPPHLLRPSSPHQLLPVSPHQIPSSPHHGRPPPLHILPSSPHRHSQQHPQLGSQHPPSPLRPVSPFPLPPSPHQYPSSPISQTSTPSPSSMSHSSSSFGLSSSEGLGTTNSPGSPVAQTSQEQLGSYKSAQWTDIFGRCKEVLKRDNIRQKTMAADIGLSGSTLSPMLRGKYRHTKEQHINMLRHWACQKDQKLRNKLLHQASALSLNNEALAPTIGLTLSTLQNWLDFSMAVNERCKVDILVLKWLKTFQARETPPRRRRSKVATPPASSQGDKTMGSFLSHTPPTDSTLSGGGPPPALQSQFSSIQLSPQKIRQGTQTLGHGLGPLLGHPGLSGNMNTGGLDQHWSPNKPDIKILPNLPVLNNTNNSPSPLSSSNVHQQHPEGEKSSHFKRKRAGSFSGGGNGANVSGGYHSFGKQDNDEEDEEEEDLGVLPPLLPMGHTAAQLQEMYSHASLLSPHHVHHPNQHQHQQQQQRPHRFTPPPFPISPSHSSSTSPLSSSSHLATPTSSIPTSIPMSSSASSSPPFSSLLTPPTPLPSGSDFSLHSYSASTTAWSSSFPSSPFLSSGFSPSLSALPGPSDLPPDLPSLSSTSLSHLDSPP